MDLDGRGTLRDRLRDTLSNAPQPLPRVLAGWESGSAAFDLVDEYSDLDLNFLLDDSAQADWLYAVVEPALETVSPVVASHAEPPGRYFKLKEGGDFLLVDVCLYRAGDYRDCLDIERHGRIRPLFDKGRWLRCDDPVRASHAAGRASRLGDLQAWFAISQSFVRKEILRGHEAEAMAAFWGYTVKPLVDLLRLRYSPARWDFGMRYLQRDLPGPVYEELRDVMFVQEFEHLAGHLSKATAWAERLIRELEPVDAVDGSPGRG